MVGSFLFLADIVEPDALQEDTLRDHADQGLPRLE